MARTMLYDGAEFEHKGKSFRVDFRDDQYADAPRSREDGHGEVSDWTTRDKAPGELVLNEDRRSKRYYDFAGAVKIAKRDRWGFPSMTPEDRESMSKGAIAAKAAMADYERLRQWCNDTWCYIGLVVTLLDEEGNDTEHEASLWGIESDCHDYHNEVALDLADEVLQLLEGLSD